jgi:EmrB/QacA subfamily drug resistance transporter
VTSHLPHRLLALAVVCSAQVLVVLDITILNVALPAIGDDLGLDAGGLQWVVSAYAVVFGGFLLLAGRVSDLHGPRRTFHAGLVLFGVASLLCGLAPGGPALLAARALQGLGAALVSPAALSIVTTTFAEGAERTKALGVWSAIAAGGSAVGLIVGGMLTEWLSWRWVFFINLPIGIAAALLSLRFVPNSRAEEKPETADIAGAVSVTGGLLVLVYALVKAQSYGWGSGKTIGLGALALALLVSFVLVELRSKAPLIRLGIFKLRSLSGSNAAMLFVFSGLFAMFYFASLYLQQVLGYGPLRAGFAFLPFTFGIVIGAGGAQQLIQRIGIRTVTYIGLTLGVIGLALFTQLPTHGSYLVNVFPTIVIVSIGMGLAFVPLTLLATTNVDDADAGLASGLFNTSQQVGGALGLAVLSTLASSQTSRLTGGSGPVIGHSAALTSGFHVAFGVGALLLIGGIAMLLVTVRRSDVARIHTEDAVVEDVAPAAA